MGFFKNVGSTEYLSDLAVAYSNGDMIADRVAPMIEMTRKLARYRVWERRIAHQITDALVAPDGKPNQRKFNATWVEKGYLPYALEDKIPLADLAEDDDFDLVEATVKHLSGDLILGREKRVADLVTTAGSYAAANKVTLTTPWTDPASTPITDIQTAKRALAAPANAMVIDEISYDALARHPDIIAFLRGSAGVKNGLATADELATYFGFKNIYVGKAKYDSANPGQTASLAQVWPQGKVVIGHIDADDALSPTLARTFAFKPEGDEHRIKVTQWDDPEPGTDGVRYVKCSTNEVSALVAADAGYLISGAA